MPRYEQNVVIDLEFAPVDRDAGVHDLRCEIIQLGAVRVGMRGEVLDNFSSFVRPEHVTQLPHAVRELTGIRMSDLVAERAIGQVLQEFREWVGPKTTRFVAWSDTDLGQLRSETREKNLPFSEQEGRWLDLQKVYPRLMGVERGKKMALRAAADWYGIRVSKENLHGALYDAMLTAELLKGLLTKDYLAQRECLASAMPEPSQSKAASYSVGERFSSLQRLKEELEAAG